MLNWLCKAWDISMLCTFILISLYFISLYEQAPEADVTMRLIIQMIRMWVYNKVHPVPKCWVFYFYMHTEYKEPSYFLTLCHMQLTGCYFTDECQWIIFMILLIVWWLHTYPGLLHWVTMTNTLLGWELGEALSHHQWPTPPRLNMPGNWCIMTLGLRDWFLKLKMQNEVPFFLTLIPLSCNAVPVIHTATIQHNP